MVSDTSWDLASHFQLLPCHGIVVILVLVLVELLHITDLGQIEAPQVVHGADADVVAAEDVQSGQGTVQGKTKVLTE